ncbi:MAG: acylphosphatase [Planctomycetota bacterium]|nr:MAG: acylphosphatase [Planctomycetota bacterium]
MNPDPHVDPNAPSPNAERRIVHYSGRVQGVGFRYCARQTAEGFSVTGSVRNLPDGRVQLVVEGNDSQVEAFLAELAARMAPNIRHVDAQRETPTGEFTAFEIRF